MQTKIQAAPVSVADVLAVLTRRLRELRARRDALTEQILGIEKSGGTAGHGLVSTDVEQVEALLEGEKFIARPKPASQLSALLAERAVFDEALRIGGSREHRLAVERASEIWRGFFPRIGEVERRRVMAALDLQRINRERERLRLEIIGAGGAGFLTTDSVDLLGIRRLARGSSLGCGAPNR